MAEQTIEQPVDKAAEPRVTEEEYLEKYAHRHYEYIDGRLVKLSPSTGTHNEIIGYIYVLIKAFLSLRPGGKIRGENFVLRFSPDEEKFREPDLMVIFDDNPNQLTETMMIGAPDVVVEVVSEESRGRDYGEKLAEYEAAGVRDYWLIDPLREVATFYTLHDARFEPEQLRTGAWESSVLPGLRIDVQTLWRDELPGFYEIGDSVREMLGE